MSKYTTQVRSICETQAGLVESVGYNSVTEIIENSRGNIFSFDYPIFDDSYKGVLETKILKHYYTREIGFETYGLWKLKLDTKLNEIMPYYNKLYESELLKYNPLYTSNLNKTTQNRRTGTETTDTDITDNTHEVTDNDTTYTETYSKIVGNTGTQTNNNTVTLNTKDKTTYNSKVDDDTSTTYGSTVTDSGSTNSKDKYSDTPQGSLSNVENNSYLTNARIIEGTNSNTQGKTGTDNVNRDVTNSGDDTVETTGTNTSNTTRTDNLTESVNGNNGYDNENDVNRVVDYTRDKKDVLTLNTTDNYVESVTGYSGVNVNRLLKDFRSNLLNIDMMIIDELDELFMQLW